jgi:uncharacterized membrane protein YjfL (UPF0719 family)
MWDFDGDEVAFILIAGFVSLIFAAKYLRIISTTSQLVCPSQKRLPLLILPVACLAIILTVLWNWSDSQVRGHLDYMTLFMVGGAMWVFGAGLFSWIVGIDLRSDAIERKNSAAAIVVGSAMLGHTFCYSGSNIGSGPTIWTTILPAIVASATLMIFWFVIELATRVSDTITIDRHVPSALVLGGFLIIAGLDLGWAMSGDWRDWQSTMDDFAVRGLPAAVLAVVAIFAIRFGKPQCTLPQAQS